jgi:hypothetical protein
MPSGSWWLVVIEMSVFKSQISKYQSIQKLISGLGGQNSVVKSDLEGHSVVKYSFRSGVFDFPLKGSIEFTGS